MIKFFLFAAVLTLVGAGCTGNVPTQENIESSPDTSLHVPALEFEAIEEMVVEEDVDTEADRQVETDTGSSDTSQQQGSEPESVLITLVAKTWEFEPSTVRVKEGQRVDLQIVSIDVTHGFNLAAFGVSETLEPGKTIRTSFVADKKGSFPFFCNVFCGDGHGGMRGTLIVE